MADYNTKAILVALKRTTIVNPSHINPSADLLNLLIMLLVDIPAYYCLRCLLIDTKIFMATWRSYSTCLANVSHMSYEYSNMS